MKAIFIDIVFVIIIFGAVQVYLSFFIEKKNRKNDSDSDDDGGLPVSLPPDIDLPPGVCLPDDPRRHQVIETEEIFA